MNDETRKQRSEEMFGAPKKKNGPPQTALEPIPPSVRPYVPPRQTRTHSEAALEAAQHVIDLESRIHSLQDELQAAQIRNNLVEEANKMLHEDLAGIKQEHAFMVARLTMERDGYLTKFLAMKTRLEASAEIILAAIDAAREADVSNKDKSTLEILDRNIAADHEAPKS